ncbi:MAG: aminotransferase class III-fold pyridoxal phosphate-dependent enzyme [Planctomycetaceae bacterium]|jgi:glutamate-1-semialdehyde 2,1-aminomutase|nr:aminotransferase class III-fold pyridoxal phosphate-dependent enzyme [Planctomycetaceae bacterium]
MVYQYTKNRELFQRALKVIPQGVPGHLGPSNGCAIPFDAFPVFAERAEGTYFWDADGNRFIDYMCAYGPNLLGYGDAEVDEAAVRQLRQGNCITSPHRILVDFAELLTETTGKDWTFFAKNGNDVTTLAVMTARCATGRSKIVLIKGGYHGVAPWTQQFGKPGILEEDVANNIVISWNSAAELEAAIARYPNQIAAFIAAPYHHPIFADSELPADGYWQTVRKLCTQHGIVLIIDDIRCGFRLDIAGSDHYYGFRADLITFCKALANGYNVSALCGVDSLRDAVSDVFYTGSYWLSAVPFAAGIACLTKLKRDGIIAKLRTTALKLQSGLRDVAKQHGRELLITGEPPLWSMRHTGDDDFYFHQSWVSECVRRGVFFTNHHNHFLNAAVTDADIAVTLDIADEAYKAVAVE